MRYILTILVLLRCNMVHAQDSGNLPADCVEVDFVKFDRMVRQPYLKLPPADITDKPELPCNKGKESFASFISKFQNDKNFRLSRMANTVTVQVELQDTASYFYHPVKDLSTGKSFTVADGLIEAYCNSWIFADADNVIYATEYESYELDNEGNANDYDIVEGVVCRYWFRRISGHWMLWHIDYGG